MDEPKKDKPTLKKDRNVFIYYTGVGFQMIATIGFFAFIGYKIDIAKSGTYGIYTAILSLVGVCISLYSTIRSVMKGR